MTDKKFLKSFVQRNRKLSRKQEILLNNTNYLVKDFVAINTDHRKINLEIGFGKGEFLLNNAQNNPDELFIGCEPFLSGVINVLQTADKHNLSNIRVFNDDVRILLTQIKQDIFDKVYILFPDPWPKAKHNKRRVINGYLLDEIFRLLKNNGQLHIVTDSDDYSEWINDLFAEENRFKIMPQNEQIQISDLNTSYYKKSQEKKNQIHIYGFYK